MTPDMQRLCEAADRAGKAKGYKAWGPENYEFAVRAVLEELRDPTRPIVRAMCKAMSPEHRPTPDRVGSDEKHRIRWRAAIDAVLSPETTKAAPI